MSSTSDQRVQRNGDVEPQADRDHVREARGLNVAAVQKVATGQLRLSGNILERGHPVGHRDRRDEAGLRMGLIETLGLRDLQQVLGHAGTGEIVVRILDQAHAHMRQHLHAVRTRPERRPHLLALDHAPAQQVDALHEERGGRQTRQQRRRGQGAGVRDRLGRQIGFVETVPAPVQQGVEATLDDGGRGFVAEVDVQ